MIVDNSAIISLETEEQREKALRRAKFEQSYKKRKKIMSGIEKTPDLNKFADNLAMQIAEFKSRRMVMS